MPNDMGSFRVDVELENPARPGQRRTVRSVLVDTGAELSWVPADVLESLGVERNNQWHFRQADGTVLERRGPGARRGNRVSRLIPGLAPGVSTTFPDPRCQHAPTSPALHRRIQRTAHRVRCYVAHQPLRLPRTHYGFRVQP